jgi:signal peptidase I
MLKTRPTPLPGHILEAALDIWTRAGEQHLIPITGCSMLPLIREGDQALVRHGWGKVRRGDVLVFRHKGTLIAHRVLRIYQGQVEPTFMTKGDNSCQPDPLVKANEIVGLVLTVKRGGRSMSLDTPAWRIVGWLIAVSTLAWMKLYGWGRAFKHRVWGPQPTRLTTFLRRGRQAFSSLLLKIVGIVFCRWEK